MTSKRPMSKILISDNGSRRPQATLMLRQIAEQLSASSGMTVDAVSLQHSDRIDPELIDGIPAQVLGDYLREQLEAGEREFIILPLFFGKSKAITSMIPQLQEGLEASFGSFDIQIADVLYPLPDGEDQLVDILYDNIQQTAEQQNITLSNIVLVDHGSPIPQVTAVRESLAGQLQQRLGENQQLAQAVMERREGKEYDFNGPLLQDYLSKLAASGAQSAIVGMMFLLPGRHAGEGGDIHEICAGVMEQNPGFTVAISKLVGEHPLLIDLLQQRLQSQLG